MLLSYAANLGCQHSQDSNPGLLLCSQVLVFIFQCWKCKILGKKHIFPKINLKNPELNFKNEIRKIKQETSKLLKKDYINDISKQHFPFLKQIILGNILKVKIQIVWRACTLTAVKHSSTGPVVHLFASHHEGPRFNPQGVTYV